MRQIHTRILAAFAFVTIIAILGIAAQRYASLDWLVSRELRLRELVRSHRLASWLIGFLIYTCLALIPGTPGKAVVCGWVFGFWAAVPMVDGALTAAALITFLMSRLLLRESVELRLGSQLAWFRKKVESDVGFYLLMLRLLHVPFSLVNYLAGATNVVRLRTFWWTTQLGLLPGTMIFVFAGTRIPSLSTIRERGVFGLLDYPLLAALATTAILPLMIKLLAAAIGRRLSVQKMDCNSADS